MNSQDASRIVGAGPRVVLDWYDGDIQAVVHDPPTGHWYLLALGLLPGGRRYAIVQVGAEAYAQAGAIEQFTSPEHAVAFGSELLASAGPSSSGYDVHVVGGTVVEVREMSHGEVAALRPRLADELYAVR